MGCLGVPAASASNEISKVHGSGRSFIDLAPPGLADGEEPRFLPSSVTKLVLSPVSAYREANECPGDRVEPTGGITRRRRLIGGQSSFRLALLLTIHLSGDRIFVLSSDRAGRHS